MMNTRSIFLLTLVICMILQACTHQAGPGEITTLPDFSAYQDVKVKKKAFFDFMRPIIQSENARVAAKRAQMLALKEKLDLGTPLNPREYQWLKALADEFSVALPDSNDIKAWKILNRRVDIVPYRLALAQSAKESAWGTSRFARQGLNMFGMWCFSKGCGIVPAQRATNMTHEVAVYPSINASVAAYLRSINRVDMYTPLRKLRHKIVKEGNKPTAIELAEKLTGYSERGEPYVSEIQAIIRSNQKLMGG